MSQPTKRPRDDGDAADEPTEGGAVVASASAAFATSSQQAMHGVAVTMSFVYTTMYHPAAVMYLLANGQVSFQQAGDLPACCNHGNWTMSGDQLTLRVSFHYKGNWAYIREHVFLRLPHTSSFELQVTHAEYRAFLIQRSAQ
jgi:hypothetical protein